MRHPVCIYCALLEKLTSMQGTTEMNCTAV